MEKRLLNQFLTGVTVGFVILGLEIYTATSEYIWLPVLRTVLIAPALLVSYAIGFGFDIFFGDDVVIPVVLLTYVFSLLATYGLMGVLLGAILNKIRDKKKIQP